MWHHDLQAAQARHAELRREAANVRAQRAARRTTRTTRQHLLDGLGQWMIALGWRLRMRYGSLETVDHRQFEY